MGEGFELLEQNMLVLYKAISRAGVRQNNPDYQDWVSFARIEYLKQFSRRGDLNDLTFNRGVGKLITFAIVAARRSKHQDQNRQEVVGAMQLDWQSGRIDHTKIEVEERILAMLQNLTASEQRVFAMLMDEGKSQSDIAIEMSLSRQAIHQKVLKIRREFLKLEAAT